MSATIEKNIILGSGSPRRKELLAGLGWNFEIKKADIEELYPDNLDASEVAEFLANLKSDAFQIEENDLLITSDTVVVLNSQVIEKPQNRSHAIEMLQRLSGNTHTVYSAVCMRTMSKRLSFTDSTEVVFNELTLDEIEFYVDKYQPYDKAGAYGIQEWIGYVAVKYIRGSFYTVMGLPIGRVYAAIEDFK